MIDFIIKKKKKKIGRGCENRKTSGTCGHALSRAELKAIVLGFISISAAVPRIQKS